VATVHREAKDLQRVEQERADVLEKVNIANRAHIARQELRAKFQNVLNARTPKLPVVSAMDAVGAGSEVLLEPSVVKQSWPILRHFCEQVRKLGKDAKVLPLLKVVAGVRSPSNVLITLTLNGNERDGSFDVMSRRDGVDSHLGDDLIFDASFDGLIAAFFLRAALPSYLAWGHGRYDRDQQFVFTQEQALSILEADHVSPGSLELQAINIPPGLRFVRDADGTLTMQCLTYHPGNGFYDYAVSLTDGHASVVRRVTLFQWGQGVYY
jgi:hypothetical protein